MLDLVIIRGLPGSGKTVLAHHLVNSSPVDVFHAEVDSFFTSVDYNEASDEYIPVYKFDRRMLGAAHDYCYGNVMRSLMQGRSAIVSNTFSTRREIDRYVEGLKRSGLRVRISVIRCLGQYDSPHNVPASAVKRMSERWEDFPGEVEHHA